MRPIDILEELLLVKGVTTNMYYGSRPATTRRYPEHEFGFGHRAQSGSRIMHLV